MRYQRRLRRGCWQLVFVRWMIWKSPSRTCPWAKKIVSSFLVNSITLRIVIQGIFLFVCFVWLPFWLENFPTQVHEWHVGSDTEPHSMNSAVLWTRGVFTNYVWECEKLLLERVSETVSLSFAASICMHLVAHTQVQSEFRYKFVNVLGVCFRGYVECGLLFDTHIPAHTHTHTQSSLLRATP
jgi:hypothetical protein